MRGHIEVAGAGLAGLTAATALARRGWSVRVHERSPELREIGAGIYLWENALRALEEVGAYDAVAARGERIHSPELRDHHHRLLQREWLREGRLYTIPRRELHTALADAAQAAGVEIRTSSAVMGASLPANWNWPTAPCSRPISCSARTACTPGSGKRSA